MKLMLRNRGVITVMLTVILVPILALSSVLVELSRYKSYQNLYSEIAELSALSTLADFDRTLYEEYGLLGMSEDQGANVKASVLENLNTDLGVLQRLASASDVSVSTDMLYSLANTNVLRRQIMEAEKIQAPLSLTTGILSGGDMTLDSLLKKMQESIEKAIPGYKIIKNVSKAASNLADVADEVTTIIKEMGEWETAVGAYTSAYRDFANAMNSYQTAADAYADSVDEEGEGDDDLKDDMDAAKTTLANSKAGYINKIDELQARAGIFFEAVEELVKKAVEFKSTVETAGYDAEKDKTEKEIDEWLASAKAAAAARTDITEEYRATLITDYEDTAKALKKEAKKDNASMKSAENALVGLADGMAGFTCGAVMAVVNARIDELKNHVNGYESAITSLDVEGTIASGGYFYYTQSRIAGMDMNDLFSTLNVLKNTTADSATASVIEVAKQLYNLLRMFGSTFKGYELGCESVITEADILPSHSHAGDGDTFVVGDDAYVTGILNGMSPTASALGYDISGLYPSSHLASAEFDAYIEGLISSVITDVGTITNALIKVAEVLSGHFWQIIKMVKDVADAFAAVLDLVDKLPQLVNHFGEVVTSLVSSLYEGALVQEYAFQRFTTRMDYKTSSGTLSGTGSSTKFVTAEVEYLIDGNISEIENQKKIFWFILIVRLLMNTAQIVSDSNIGSIAAAAGPFAPLVYIGWIAAETYIDTALLTETTTKIPLVKGDILLSPGGLANLANAISDVTAGFTVKKSAAETVDEIEKTIASVMKDVYKDDIFKLNYEDFLWIRLCFVSNEKKLGRIADLIQMNMRQSTPDFLLANAWTYLRVEVKADYHTVMPTFNMAEGGKLRVLKYVGY